MEDLLILSHLLFSIIVLTSYFYITNKYSKRTECPLSLLLLNKIYLRLMALEVTLDGQLSHILDLYHLKE